MFEGSGIHAFDLICVIVNFGAGSKVVRSGKKHGLSGATVMLGRGTVSSHILDFMGISDIRKEIVLMAAERPVSERALEEMNREFEFHKPNHGIAFTTSICGVFGTKSMHCGKHHEKREAAETMYHIINAIVEKGKAEDVIEAAVKAGSKGGTIINARGSGVHETSKVFSMEIEPEKEIVLILSEAALTDKIVSAILEGLKMDEPGRGIVYVQEANRTYGIYR